MTHRLVIDTDGGVDDAAALWWALRSPDVEVVGLVATWGNVTRDVAAANIARILHAADRPDIPFALGEEGPIGPTPLDDLAHYVHGEDGLGGHAHEWDTGGLAPEEEPASALLTRLTGDHPGEVDLVAIGPLSSVATALQADPFLARRLRSFTIMGGAVRVGGNALPLGEANIAHDPRAAAEVVGAAWDLEQPPLLVGLDVTKGALLGDEERELLDAGGSLPARFLSGPFVGYRRFYAESKQAPEGSCPCHDLMAVLAAVDPTILTHAPVAPMAVDDAGGPAWGTTVADLRAVPEAFDPHARPWRVGLEVDADRFRAEFRSLLVD